MKNIICVFIFGFLFVAVSGQKAKHVVLISIDGFRPDFYLDSNWKADNIRSLMHKGIYALGVNSVFPSLTYPSHTTIISGVLPAKHGILYNAPFLSPVKRDSIYWKFSSIKSTTLWEQLRNTGRKTAAVKWPVSAGAPVDYIIPDAGRVGLNTCNYSLPHGIIEEINKNIFGVEGLDLTFFQNHDDINSAKILCYLINNYKPDFVAIHLMGVDHAEHLEGPNGKLVKKNVLLADQAVGLILKSIEEAGIASSTCIIITGDHGFQAVNTEVNPNVWLKAKGFQNNNYEDRRPAFFYAAGGSAFLYVQGKNRKRTIRKIKKLLTELPSYERQFFSVISKKNIIKAGADPKASLALTAKNGAVFGIQTEGDAIINKSKTSGAHGYFPDSEGMQTGFVANGSGIKSGLVIKQMALTDIAPFITDLLGINFSHLSSKVKNFMRQFLK
jgi:predicted AlkP superfamily pyrophosphatase or phosphodiesterase